MRLAIPACCASILTLTLVAFSWAADVQAQQALGASRLTHADGRIATAVRPPLSYLPMPYVDPSPAFKGGEDLIITHSLSVNIEFGGVACGTEGEGTSENSIWRVFDLSEFEITEDIVVTSVEFGIGNATINGAPLPSQINLYTLQGELVTANLTLVASAPYDITAQDNFRSVEVPINGAAFSAGDVMVVEWYYPDGRPEGESVYFGANDDGQTGPTYLSSANCTGVGPEPIDIAALGYPNSHWMLVVHAISLLTFDPLVLEATLEPGETDDESFIITNNTPGPVTVSFPQYLPASRQAPAPPSVPHLELVKGERDPRTGSGAAARDGGGYSSGYTWIDSDEPGGPVYNWVDISATGTPLILGDDEWGFVALPFTFELFGTDYNTINVASNGYLNFADDSRPDEDYLNQLIPDSNLPNGVVAPFWDDLDPGDGVGQVLYQDMGDGRFIVTYEGVPHYPGPGGGEDTYTFQVILYQDGRIRYQYEAMNNFVDSATIGVESPDGMSGLQIVYNSLYVHDGLAVLIQPEPSFVTSVQPAERVIQPGASEPFTATFNAHSLAGGTYEGALGVATSVGGFAYPVELTVLEPAPPDSVTFEPSTLQVTLEQGQSADRTFTITNPNEEEVAFVFPQFSNGALQVAAPVQPSVGRRQRPARRDRATRGPRPDVIPQRGSGGPDLFGYFWRDSDEPDGPAFESSIDISGTGTSVLFGEGDCEDGDADDEGYADLPLPFSFSFYGVEYSAIRVYPNGLLSFNMTVADCTYSIPPIPTPGYPDNLIAPFWSDLEVGDEGLIQYETLGDGRFVVQWTDVPVFGGGSLNTFQVILSSLGGIKYQYIELADLFYSAGIEALDGTTGLQVGSVHNGLAVEIYRALGFELVTSVSPAAGTIQPGSSVDISVMFTAAADANATYQSALLIDTNPATDSSGYAYPVEITVTDIPQDSAEPVCTVLSNDDGFYTGQATDPFSTPNNTGIASLNFVGTNLALPSVEPPIPGGPPYPESVTFVVGLTDPNMDGSGTVTATDGNGNDCFLQFTIGRSNLPPTAQNDEDETTRDTPVPINVLDNDTDPDDDQSELFLVSPPGDPLHGTTSIIGRQVQYVPNPGYVGPDEFSYTISDPDGATGTANVTVTVSAPPVGTVTCPSPGTAQAGSGATISVTVQGFAPDTGSPETGLFYRRAGSTGGFTRAALSPSGGGNYQATIPGPAVTERGVDYYVAATNGTNAAASCPPNNPEGSPRYLAVNVPGLTVPSNAAPASNGSYRMVSVPLVLADPSVRAVFEDDYGSQDDTRWRALRWQPASGAYAEYPNLGTGLTPGVAVWAATRVGAPLDVGAGTSVPASSQSAYVLGLDPGWNQIGNPFAFRVAWSSVGGSGSLGTPRVYTGSGSDYDFAEVLEPWMGYFVNNSTGARVSLSFYPVEAPPGLNVAPEPPAGYRLRLRAEAEEQGLRDTQNLVGLAEGAAPGRDSLDAGEPPPIGEHVRLSVLADGDRLDHSFQADEGEGAAWEAELAATDGVLEGGAMRVRVALEEESARPEGYERYVFDLDRATILPLSEEAFEVTLTAAEPVRRLRVVVGTEAFAQSASGGIPLVPPEYALGPAHPNPVRGRAALTYQLAERGRAVLEVFDLLGRRVALLVDAEQDAGRYSVPWASEAVSSGVYVCRLRAGSFVATEKVTVLR